MQNASLAADSFREGPHPRLKPVGRDVAPQRLVGRGIWLIAVNAQRRRLGAPKQADRADIGPDVEHHRVRRRPCLDVVPTLDEGFVEEEQWTVVRSMMQHETVTEPQRRELLLLTAILPDRLPIHREAHQRPEIPQSLELPAGTKQ